VSHAALSDFHLHEVHVVFQACEIMVNKKKKGRKVELSTLQGLEFETLALGQYYTY